MNKAAPTPDQYWNPPVDIEGISRLFDRVSYAQEGCLAAFSKNTLADLEALAQITGATPHKHAIFSDDRLILQETIIACDSRLKIKDDARSVVIYGRNFRDTFHFIHQDYVVPHMGHIKQQLQKVRDQIQKDISADVDRLLSAEGTERELLMSDWHMSSMESGGYETTDFQRATRAKVSGITHHYRILQEKQEELGLSPDEFRSTLERLAFSTTYDQAARDIVQAEIKTCIKAAIKDGKVKPLPTSQAKDAFVYCTHGAPASGKSTLRPKIRKAVEKSGVEWEDVMVLNPDVWRKILLDPEHLGDDVDYWGPLTDSELTLMWTRMSDLLTRTRWKQPHIMVDHFYPDNMHLYKFADRSDHCHVSILFAHPEQVLERSYMRGSTQGRYINREGLLFNIGAVHNELHRFLSGAAGDNARIEIIDNSVDKGQDPHTVAFGDFGKRELNIYDVSGIVLIQKYGNVNPQATTRDELFAGVSQKPEDHLKLLDSLRDGLTLKFIGEDGATYAEYNRADGLSVHDEDYFTSQMDDPYNSAVFKHLAEQQKSEITYRVVNTGKAAANDIGMVGTPAHNSSIRSLEN